MFVVQAGFCVFEHILTDRIHRIPIHCDALRSFDGHHVLTFAVLCQAFPYFHGVEKQKKISGGV